MKKRAGPTEDGPLPPFIFSNVLLESSRQKPKVEKSKLFNLAITFPRSPFLEEEEKKEWKYVITCLGAGYVGLCFSFCVA